MKEFKEKKHFNFVDILIIVGVALIVLGIIFRAQIIGIFYDTASMNDYIITFEADNVPSAVTERIQNGRHVRWVEKDLMLGKLDNVTSSPAVIYIENPDGTFSPVTLTDHFKVTGSIRVEGTENNGLHVNGTAFLAAGMEIVISTETAQFTATVTSVVSDK